MISFARKWRHRRRRLDGHGSGGKIPRRFARGVTSALALPVMLAFAAPAAAAPDGPHLTGAIHIDLEGGGIRGDVCLAGLPTSGDTVRFVLNSTLTVEHISGVRARAVAVEEEPGGATVRYTYAGASPRSSTDGRTVTDICLAYGGIQPVYVTAEGEYRDDDASNVIAFNGTTLRARGAARWYPAPFDPRAGAAQEAISFDLQIECTLCERVYANGSDPSSGGEARIRSDEPRELFLIAGRLPITQRPTGRFIGEVVAPDTADLFLAKLTEIQDFLAGYVGVAYGRMPDIVRVAAVRRPRRGQVWGFFSDPALTLIGMGPGEFVRTLSEPSTPARRALTGFLSHELAHRYFGWSFGAASPQRDLFGEPFATYLEMKAIRNFIGEDEYRASLRRLLRRGAELPAPVPLSESTPADYAAGGYRYGYAPLMLFALEATIGEPAMRRLLQTMLDASAAEREYADLDFIGRSALRAGVAPDRWSHFLEICQAGPVESNTCLEWMGGPADIDAKSERISQRSLR